MESKAANLDISIDKRHSYDLKRAQSDLIRLQAPNMYQPLKDVFQKVMDQNRELAAIVQRGVIHEDDFEQACMQTLQDESLILMSPKTDSSGRQIKNFYN